MSDPPRSHGARSSIEVHGRGSEAAGIPWTTVEDRDAGGVRAGSTRTAGAVRRGCPADPSVGPGACSCRPSLTGPRRADQH
ncbi:hypothetical protein C884_02429 [Kocuria palustris PEL]|uniref:Uncharacterized protein n=1 Tax=Kocuria palustris PEL TaxID=1236550 RepID=M2WE72_9MICC|nr:hypothetical protein C884_02429 [Kocuria palustris PEL]